MKKLIYALIIVFLLVFLFATFMLFKELKQRNDDIKAFEELYVLVSDSTKDIPAINENVAQQDAENFEASGPQAVPISQKLMDLSPLLELNSDCIGWLSIDGTNISYPIMHTPYYPQKYLRMNFNGQYSVSGIPFLDGSISADDMNLVIYGHNMSNGTMFAQLEKYFDESFYLENPIITFQTADALYKFEIFAVAKVKNDDSWYFFNNCDDEFEFYSKVADLKSRSLYHTEVVPTFGQKLITLSTCLGRSGDNRTIVVGSCKSVIYTDKLGY